MSEFNSISKNKFTKYGIFLMFGDLSGTIIESQVLVHIKSMKYFGIEMELWIFASDIHSYARAQSSLNNLRKEYDIKIKLFKCVRLGVPFSPILNAIKIVYFIAKYKIFVDFIHGRTDYAAMVGILVKKIYPVQVIWDARGDSIAEIFWNQKSKNIYFKLLFEIRKYIQNRRILLVANRSDKAIFVSSELRKRQAPNMGDENIQIIPCLADENLFNFSRELRSTARKTLGYEDGDIVLIYVGSTAPWQCIEQTIALFEAALSSNALVRVLVVTPDLEKFSALFSKKSPRILMVSAKLAEVNYYLNAADFGVMLRDCSPINFVASPVKFAEYSLSGISVITTQAVEQVNTFGRHLGNIISPNEFLINISTINQGINISSRANISINAKKILSRQYGADFKSIY